MTRKLGGIPVWAWAAAAVAGLVLGYYLRHRTSSSGIASSPLPAATFGGDSVGAGAPDTVSPELAGLASSALGAIVAANEGVLALAANAQGALVAQGQTLGSLAETAVGANAQIAESALIANVIGQATPPAIAPIAVAYPTATPPASQPRTLARYVTPTGAAYPAPSSLGPGTPSSGLGLVLTPGQGPH